MSGTWADAGLRVVWTDFPEKVALPQVLSATLLLDLEADTLALNDGDPVSVWTDQGGNGYDFTQTGTARPTKQTINGYPVVIFDGVDDWMLGQNVIDNLERVTVFLVGNLRFISSGYDVITKINDDASDPGWDIGDFQNMLIQEDGDNFYVANKGVSQGGINFYTKHLAVIEKSSNTNFSFRYDGGSPDVYMQQVGTVNTFATNTPMVLATTYSHNAGFEGMDLYCILFYSPNPNEADRAAITTWLANRYGITL